MSDRDPLWGMAAELAGLPGMPLTPRGIQLYAERAGWLKRNRARGKGFEYHVGLLPAAARAELMERRGQAGTLPAIAESQAVTVVPLATLPARQDAPGMQDLKKWQRDILDARRVILREVERREAASSLKEAIDTVVELAGEGMLPPAVQAALSFALAKSSKGQEGLSASTLHRWRAAEKRGLGALAPAAMDLGQIPPWVNIFMKFYRSPHRPTVTATLRLMREQGIEAGLIPSYPQALRHIEKIGDVEAVRGRVSRLKMTAMLPFTRRDTSMVRPGEIYNGDGHLSYMLVMHPNTGRPFRAELTEVFDVGIREHAGWSINFSENTHAVVDALRMAIMRNGVPKIVHWDNGSGAKNKNLQDEVTGLKNRLGFEFYHQQPGNPQAGGIVERGHQQVLIPAAKRFESYVGRREKDDGLLRIKMQQYKAGKIRIPTVEEVVAVIDTLRAQYNNTPHSALPWMIDPITNKKRHESPNEARQRYVNEGWKPVVIQDALEEFRLEETRTVLRGEIRFHTMHYSNASGLRDWHGKKVRVRYDVRDGSKIWVWSLDKHDRFICAAGRDANVRPYLADSVLEHGEQIRLRGQLQRLDRKRAEMLAEANKTLEAVAIPLTIEQEETANAMMERLGMLEPPHSAEIIPLHEEEILADGMSRRPLFSGPLAERDWGHWALAHWDELDEEEQDTLEAKLEDPRFRMLLGLDDADDTADQGLKKKVG